MRSYRDLPMRFAEWGTVYRFERSGVLHGLTRVRGFTQDDAHLFCRPDQMPEEIDKVLNFSLDILRAFGFDTFELYLSTRPPKRVGREEDWDAAEAALEDTLKRSGIKYQVNAGDGAFYRPEDRSPRQGCDRTAVAAEHGSVRLQSARALRSELCRGRRRHIGRS